MYSEILTGEQVTCQVEHMGQVLVLPALISLPARCRSIPSLLPSEGCVRSQEILPRHLWVDSQPHSGFTAGRTESIIPVMGWAGLLLPPTLISPYYVQSIPQGSVGSTSYEDLSLPQSLPRGRQQESHDLGVSGG